MLDYTLITGWKWPGGGHPNSFGWYHIMWLVIMVAVTILLCKFLATKHNKKTDDHVIFAFGCMLLTIELYKQIFYTLDYGYYPFYIFPYQFCSVPMFVAFIAPLVKNEKVKEAMYKFLAFFGLLAGVSVMLYPESCLYTSYITILIHTMLWHASMVVMGIYLIVAREYGKNLIKEIVPGSIVYVIVVAIALVANIVGYKLFFGNPESSVYGQSWFLMYISPYYSTPLPILSIIKEKAPYPVFLLCYILAFVLGVSLLFGITFLVRKLSSKKKNATKN